MKRKILILYIALALSGPLQAHAGEHIKCGWRIDASGQEYHSCWFLH